MAETEIEKPKRPNKHQYYERLLERLKMEQFASGPGGELLFYDRGRFHPDPKRKKFGSLVQGVMQGLGMDQIWEDEFIEKSRNHLSRHCRDLWAEPPHDRICAANGVLDLVSGEIVPHSPEWLCTTSLPVTYDPKAECPFWQEYLSGISHHSYLPFFWQIIGSTMTPGTTAQTALWFQGPGSNGKSTLGLGMFGFLGRDNCISFKLSQLMTEKYLLADFANKLLAADFDTPQITIKDASILKKLITADPINARRIYGEPFEMVYKGKMIICSNHSPDFMEKSKGISRRLLTVPIERVFEPGAKGTMSQSTILAKLHSPGELSGLLNMAIKGWKEIELQNAFTLPQSVLDHTNISRARLSPLAKFCDENVIRRDGTWVFKQSFHSTVNTWLKSKGEPEMSDQDIGRVMKGLYAHINKSSEIKKPDTDGTMKRVYDGIELMAFGGFN